MSPPNRAYLNFAESVKQAFSFLEDLGFVVIDRASTLVCYRNSSVEVDIYHGRQSYEIGAGITAFGTRYSISEIIRALDPETEEQFQYPTAHTRERVVVSLELMSSLMKRFGNEALKGDSKFFVKLAKQRKVWTEEYALEVLTRQIRPKAQAAFRRKDYPAAANLYARIRKCLSPAEIEKLRYAEKHSQ